MQVSSARARLRRHPLGAVIALALAGVPLAGAPFPTAHADTLPVTSCADDGSPGTLRSVVASAHDGDTIDMTQLTCGTITLAQGQIETGYLASATLAGPGRDKLKISGGGESPVLYLGAHHYISARFTLRDLTIAHARTTNDNKYSHASCISNLSGFVILERVDITDCHTYLQPSDVIGGGAIYAAQLTMLDSTITSSSVEGVAGYDGAVQGGGATANFATLIRSTISGNTAIGQQNVPYHSGGGGLWAGSLVMMDSVITGNLCEATDGGQDVSGGGIYVAQDATILRSLIANNTTDGDGGGLFKGSLSNGGRATFTIQDSTIAGNSAGGVGGALVSQWPVSIANSTLADNTSARGGAVRLNLYRRDSYGNYFVLGWPDFESTIIAGNVAGPGATYPTDLSTDAALTVFGAHNLIGGAGADTDPGLTLPPDTLRGDPQLNPLADNGGRSETMAPLPGSPVINAGANALGFLVDQRGPDFVRTYGTATDIGAYEVQSSPVPHASRPPEPVNPVIAANHAPTALPVTSCADDGSPGTLRSVAAQALDGDTIDMSGLTCSTITLTQGPIDTSLLGPNPLDQVTIVGPGQDALTVSGNGASAVFIAGGDYHTGTSPLMALSDLTIAHGVKYDAPGCVAAVTGSIELDGVTVTDCHSRTAGGGGVWPGHSNGGGAVGAGYAHVVASTISHSDITAVDRNIAAGGGLWAGKAVITNSTISGNSVSAPVQTAYQGYQTAGGGVYTSATLYVTDSLISGNTVEATENSQNANGGGAFAHYYGEVTDSAVASNIADGIGGGLFLGFARANYGSNAPSIAPSTKISNSTFAGNSALAGGAIATESVATILANSTIASNDTSQGGALMIVSPWSNEYSIYMDSTIIAGNTIDGAGGHAADLAASPNLTLTVTGSNNLVGSADPNVTLPPDTLGGDPLLLPLADNGGPTWTMALAPGSPAINAGSNPWAFDTDQRGAGFARVYGPTADIGAYEVQPAGDVIFNSGFDD